MPPAMTLPKVCATPSRYKSPHLRDKATVPCVGRAVATLRGAASCPSASRSLFSTRIARDRCAPLSLGKAWGVRSPPGTRDRQLWLWRPSHGGVREASRRHPSSQGWAEGGPLERAPSLSLIFWVKSCLITTQKKKKVSLIDMSVSCSSKQCIRQALSVGHEPRAPTSQGPARPGKLRPSCKTLSSKQLYRILYIYTKIEPLYMRVYWELVQVGMMRHHQW